NDGRRAETGKLREQVSAVRTQKAHVSSVIQITSAEGDDQRNSRRSQCAEEGRNGSVMGMDQIGFQTCDLPAQVKPAFEQKPRRGSTIKKESVRVGNEFNGRLAKIIELALSLPGITATPRRGEFAQWLSGLSGVLMTSVAISPAIEPVVHPLQDAERPNKPVPSKQASGVLSTLSL